jgi:peptide subunit release factor 1 (eRF1)
MRTTADEVAAAVRAARESHAVVVERGLALAVRQGLGTGWAENGLEGTLRDLTHGRVRHLVVRADAAGAGFRCATTGRLVQRADQCRGEGAPRPVRDLIGAAVEEAHRQGVPVTVLQVPDAARKIDGIAALLRFR